VEYLVFALGDVGTGVCSGENKGTRVSRLPVKGRRERRGENLSS